MIEVILEGRAAVFFVVCTKMVLEIRLSGGLAEEKENGAKDEKRR